MAVVWIGAGQRDDIFVSVFLVMRISLSCSFTHRLIVLFSHSSSHCLVLSSTISRENRFKQFLVPGLGLALLKNSVIHVPSTLFFTFSQFSIGRIPFGPELQTT